MYSAECDGPKFYKTLMFLGQAGMFLSFQARRSSAKRSSTSDLTVVLILFTSSTLTDNKLIQRQQVMRSFINVFRNPLTIKNTH